MGSQNFYLGALSEIFEESRACDPRQSTSDDGVAPAAVKASARRSGPPESGLFRTYNFLENARLRTRFPLSEFKMQH